MLEESKAALKQAQEKVAKSEADLKAGQEKKKKAADTRKKATTDAEAAKKKAETV